MYNAGGIDFTHAIWFGAVAVFATIAMFTDWRSRIIPNWLTLPGLVIGLFYQATVNGVPGVVNGISGFGVGFGLLFILWICGGGGGGDVKLAGALGVWLGPQQTLCVIVCSTLFIALTTFTYLIYGWFSSHINPSPNRLPAQKQRGLPRVRLTIPFAIPVGFATWILLLGNGLFHQSL